MNRRQFLLTSAGLVCVGEICSCISHRHEAPFSGSILGASHNIGHLLREGKVPAATQERKVPVVIVGGGISGLSAGWKLDKAGFGEFEILELESEIGGNSRFGENQVSPYPWGAHYVPIPTKESRAVRELFEELGVIQGYTSSGQPIFEEKNGFTFTEDGRKDYSPWLGSLKGIWINMNGSEPWSFITKGTEVETEGRPFVFPWNSVRRTRSSWRWTSFLSVTSCTTRGSIRYRSTGT